MKSIISMVLGFIVMAFGAYATSTNPRWAFLIAVGLAMILIPPIMVQRRYKKDLLEHRQEAIDKFGNDNPPMDAICSVCHKPHGEHLFPYECPKNAFYNYKTGQCHHNDT